MRLEKIFVAVPALLFSFFLATSTVFANQYNDYVVEVTRFGRVEGKVLDIEGKYEDAIGGYTIVRTVRIQTDKDMEYDILVATTTPLIKNGKIVNFDILEKGDNIVVSYDAFMPAPAIYPPQLRASTIVIGDGEDSWTVHVDIFKAYDDYLLSYDQSLRIPITEETNIIGLEHNDNDKHHNASHLHNKILAVIYGPTSMSIPAVPIKPIVIVLGENEFINEETIIQEEVIINMLDFLPPFARGDRGISFERTIDIEDTSYYTGLEVLLLNRLINDDNLIEML